MSSMSGSGLDPQAVVINNTNEILTFSLMGLYCSRENTVNSGTHLKTQIFFELKKRIMRKIRGGD